jgi:thiamine biosynthesis lipoprotein ApbE
MNLAKIEIVRARPALDTVIVMRLKAPADISVEEVDAVVGRAFALVEELEERFSQTRESSDICRLNCAAVHREIPVSRAFIQLAELAQKVWKTSGGAYNPFSGAEIPTGSEPLILVKDGGQSFAQKNQPVELNFSALVRGFVIDRVAGLVSKSLPVLSGEVTAGGDLRIFHSENLSLDDENLIERCATHFSAAIAAEKSL